MTDTEYLVEMLHLITRLTDACNNFGLHSPEYNAVLKDITTIAAHFNRRRRRRPLCAIVTIFVLSCILGWLVYYCLCLLDF